MNILYSNILPLMNKEGQERIADAIEREVSRADRIDIAVGYVSNSALEELDKWVEQYEVKDICLNIGMYFVEGMPELSYHTALRINKKWRELGIGEIRIIKAFKYHGKVYCFYKDGKPISAIMGSSNLGVIKLEANNRRHHSIINIPVTGNLPAIATIIFHNFRKVVVDSIEFKSVFLTPGDSIRQGFADAAGPENKLVAIGFPLF